MLIDYNIYQAMKKVQEELESNPELLFHLWWNPQLGWQAEFTHFGLNPSPEKVFSENPNEVIYAAILRIKETNQD